jgi:hypothetical protein
MKPMGNKDLQYIESKVRDSQMRYLDIHLSPDLFERLTQLLYLKAEREKGIAFYGLINYHNPVIFPIPDIKVLGQEIAYLRSKLRDANKVGNNPKRRRKRNHPVKKPVKRMRLPELDISGNTNSPSQLHNNQENQSQPFNSVPPWPVQMPDQTNYFKKAEKWTPAQIEDWSKGLKDRISKVENGSDEEIQEVFREIAWENDGIIKNRIAIVDKEPTTENIINTLNQIALGQSVGGNEAIASEALEATGNAQLKRLIASYRIYKVMKQKRYFIDLINELAGAQSLGCRNDPVMNRIEEEIRVINPSEI